MLDIRPRRFLVRTLSARPPGALALVAATAALRRAGRSPRAPGGGLSLLRWLPLAAHLAVGCLAYAAAYLAAPAGPGRPDRGRRQAPAAGRGAESGLTARAGAPGLSGVDRHRSRPHVGPSARRSVVRPR